VDILVWADDLRLTTDGRPGDLSESSVVRYRQLFKLKTPGSRASVWQAFSNRSWKQPDWAKLQLSFACRTKRTQSLPWSGI